MSPVVLETPVINMHNPSLGSMPRIQQFPPAQSDQPSNSSSSETRQGSILFILYLPRICLTTRNIANSEDPNGASNVLAPGRSPCMNCGTTATPLWRRDADGNPVCNACGKFSYPSSPCFISFPVAASKKPHQSHPRHTRGK